MSTAAPMLPDSVATDKLSMKTEKYIAEFTERSISRTLEYSRRM